jgi:hypothetical protein
MKFNVIVGNPPYQVPADKKGKTGNGGAILWPKFVYKAFNEIVKDNGYISLIHPPIWRKPEHKILLFLKDYNGIVLKIHNLKDGQKLFNVSTAFDWYVFQKRKNISTPMKIIANQVTTHINLADCKFICDDPSSPLMKYFDNNCKTEVLFSETVFFTRKGKIQKNSTYNTPAYYSKKDGNIQKRYFQYNKKMDEFLVPKVIIQLTGHKFNFHLDEIGEMGICQFSCAIPIKSKEYGIEIINWFKKHEEEFNNFKWGMTRPWRLFKYLKSNFYKVK